jgi:hypothetical protein
LECLKDGISGFGDIRWVSLIGRSEFQMMGRILQLEHNDARRSSDVGVHTSSTPWVKISVSEDDVRMACKVLLDVLPSEVVPNPSVSWSQAIFLLAVS